MQQNSTKLEDEVYFQDSSKVNTFLATIDGMILDRQSLA